MFIHDVYFDGKVLELKKLLNLTSILIVGIFYVTFSFKDSKIFYLLASVNIKILQKL